MRQYCQISFFVANIMKVGVALYNKTLLTSVTLACEMLISAHTLCSRSTRKGDTVNIEVVAPQGFKPMGGIYPHIDIHYDTFNQYDIILLPPMWGNPKPVIKQHPEIIEWLLRQYNGGARIIATGTGVCWLAQTGLLNDKVATTHWYFYDRFAAMYPHVKLNRRASVTKTSGLYCARSINSQTELIIYLISRYFGSRISKVIEEHYMHEVSGVSEQPFFEEGGSIQFDEHVAIAQSYINQNMHLPLTLEKIAEHCGISKRTLTRRFEQQVGESPHKYLIRVRMKQAKALLHDINLSLQEIAELIGFKDSHYFSNQFKQYFDISPKRYRQIVKAKTYRDS